MVAISVAVLVSVNGMIDGGFGEKIARFYGPSTMKILNYGIEKSFPDRYDVQALLKENRLYVEDIVEDIQSNI